jgi:hypothetical protein
MESGWHTLCFDRRTEAVMPNFSPHAHRRSAQRSVPAEHIELALAWGCPIRQTDGRIAWHLGRREADDARDTGVSIPDRAIGVAVVLAADGTVVTVVRSDDRRRLTTYGRPWPLRSRRGGRR